MLERVCQNHCTQNSEQRRNNFFDEKQNPLVSGFCFIIVLIIRF